MGWRPVYEPDVLESLQRRLRSLEPDAPARWGTMNAPRMVCHLGDQMYGALGRSSFPTHPGILRWAPMRWLLIHVLPWPKGKVQGPPEAFLSRPRTWDADVEKLSSYLDQFVAMDPAAPCPEHLLFGRMTRKDWGLAWLAGLLAVPLSQLPIVSSQNFLDPTLASLIVTTSPATAAILGPILLNERVSMPISPPR